MRKHNEGFTLVELLVTIVVAAIVTMAATTVLLLGIRLNQNSTTTVQQQNTVRIFLSVMERMATEGTITEVVNELDSWKVMEGENEDKSELFSYNSKDRTIYTRGTPMMEEVIASNISLIGNLLTVGVETEDGSYTTSVYCRKRPNGTPNVPDPEENLDQSAQPEIKGKAARAEFLKALISQRGSTGMILKNIDEIMTQTPLYYSEWYAGVNLGEAWSIDTPWCGCFISWGLEQDFDKDEVTVREQVNSSDHTWFLRFANVDNAKTFFEETNDWKVPVNPDPDSPNFEPAPGDLIFFDWSGERKDAAHMGAVLAVLPDEADESKKYIYTIEGNSANMVAVRKYAIDDAVIMGYGVIDWMPDPEPQSE